MTDATLAVAAKVAGDETIAGPHLIDGHVHLYDCFDQAQFLDSAAANFRWAAIRRGFDPDSLGWLLLTETSRDHYFTRFQRAATAGGNGGVWAFRTTAEDCSLYARRDDGVALGLVAGRQIATREGLEVLALGCNTEFADGLSLQETLDRVRGAGAIAVIPWGFGKWWGARGKLVTRTLRAAGSDCPMMGDNGGRPRGGLLPAPLVMALEMGIPILPGSDPLPLRSQGGRAGTYGFMLNGTIERDRPAASFRDILRARQQRPRIFGHPNGLPAALINQIALRLRRRGQASTRPGAEAGSRTTPSITKA